MTNFAVIKNNVVINTIVADSLSIATELTGETCVPFTEENPASIGGEYDSSKDKFIQVQPFPSWVLSKDIWVPPIPQPELSPNESCYWNEETLDWDIITL